MCARRREQPRGPVLRSHRCAVIVLAGTLQVLLCAAVLTSSAAAAPIVLEHDVTLQTQFGYAPPYPLNVPAFDTFGRPLIRERGEDQHATSGVFSLGDAGWEHRGFLDAVRAAVPHFDAVVNGGGWETDRVVPARNGVLYTPLTVRLTSGRRRHLLLHSADGGATWSAVPVTRSSFPAPPADLDAGDLVVEHFTGHNRIVGPPLTLVWRRTAHRVSRWAQRSFLYVTRPYEAAKGMVVPRPVLLTRRALPTCQAAGGASPSVTIGRRSFIVYVELARGNDRRGSPVYVAVYDAGKRRVTSRRRVGFALPGNDFHTAPGICMDARGYLHIVIGSHGGRFRHVRSKRPRSNVGGWTRPRTILESGYKSSDTDSDGRGRQTYVSLVCDAGNTLHLVYRQWRRGVDRYFLSGGYGALSHQRWRPGRGWSAPRLVVVPPSAGYVNYYQKLAVDGRGRLFLSLSCWLGSEALESRAVESRARYRRRMLLVCDNGRTWRFATTDDLTASASTAHAE